MGPQVPEPVADDAHGRDAEMADPVGAALLVVLETLAPAERLAFVLHDMFAVPFEEIAPIVGRTPSCGTTIGQPRLPAGCRAHRRRTPISAGRKTSSRPSSGLRAKAISKGLLAVLDPEVVLRADTAAQRLGSLAEIHGAQAVAEAFKGRARTARPALVDGTLALAVILGGQLRIVVRLTISGERMIGDRCRGGRRTDPARST